MVPLTSGSYRCRLDTDLLSLVFFNSSVGQRDLPLNSVEYAQLECCHSMLCNSLIEVFVLSNYNC